MKKFLKFMEKVVCNFWVRLIVLIGCIVALFWLGGAFKSWSTAGDKVIEILTSVDLVSVFLLAIVSLLVATLVLKAMAVLEESKKIEDDHHKIIAKYSDHKKNRRKVSKTTDFFDKSGMTMDLYNVVKHKHEPKNPVKDKFSSDYAKRQEDIDDYLSGKLNLPSVSVFANVLGKANVRIVDKNEYYTLPTFVTENALLLMGAHKDSSLRNNDTIRLDDVDFDGNELVLKTSRTRYFDMLVTNRCMDYKINDTVSIRETYEFGSAVSTLEGSKLANQIGINGLIFSRDGYLLLEKRGRKKAIWKDKFAQPISLAMKKSSVKLGKDGKIGESPDDANDTFKNIILDTVCTNFGLTEDDLEEFKLSDNLLGIARDLLEGGKPNIYFYVVAKYDRDELAKRISDKCKKFGEENKKARDEAKKKRKALLASGAPAEVVENAEEGKEGEKGKTDKKKKSDLPKLSRDKLDSDFYLINKDDIFIDYDYTLAVKARDIVKIKRKHKPRVGAFKSATEGNIHKLRRAFGVKLKKECGEALLACLYFANVCGDRINRELTGACNGKAQLSAVEDGSEQ